MKRMACIALMTLALLCTSEALAAKARSIATNADSDYHDSHLALHIGDINCHGTGNYVKIKTQAGGDNIVGHLEQADSFNLVDVQNGWALIQITISASTSPDSQAGMTGWVDADYIDCTCSTTQYASGDVIINNGVIRNTISDILSCTEWNTYEQVLDTYYKIIISNQTLPIDDVRMEEISCILGVFLEPGMYPSLNSGYIIRDINNDGIDELIILHAGGQYYEDAMIIALYTLVNQKPTLVLTGANRSSFYLGKDGSLVNYGSDGAAYSRYYVFDLVGDKLIVRDGIISDWNEIDGEMYFYTTDTDLDTSNDIRVDEDYAIHHKFVEEDHDPQGFISFEEYGKRK